MKMTEDEMLAALKSLGITTPEQAQQMMNKFREYRAREKEKHNAEAEAGR